MFSRRSFRIFSFTIPKLRSTLWVKKKKEKKAAAERKTRKMRRRGWKHLGRRLVDNIINDYNIESSDRHTNNIKLVYFFALFSAAFFSLSSFSFVSSSPHKRTRRRRKERYSFSGKSNKLFFLSPRPCPHPRTSHREPRQNFPPRLALLLFFWFTALT